MGASAQRRASLWEPLYTPGLACIVCLHSSAKHIADLLLTRALAGICTLTHVFFAVGHLVLGASTAILTASLPK